MVPALILSSDSHVFEPPDLWTTRIDAAFRDRAPRMERIDGADDVIGEQQANLILRAPERVIAAANRFPEDLMLE